MRVYEMSARFSRKVQVKQFEPAECEFEMKVELDETDDPLAVREHIMQEVRDAVTQAFKGSTGKGSKVTVTRTDDSGESKTPETPTEAKEEKPPKKQRGRPKGSTNKSKAKKTEDSPTSESDETKVAVAESGDDWDTIPSGKTTEEVVEEAEETKDDEEEEESGVDLATLRALVNKVTGDGVLIKDVKAKLDEYAVNSTTELDPEYYDEFYDFLLELQSNKEDKAIKL